MANAQEPQIIGGYLLDGKDSFEELDAAVVTDSKSKVKTLTGKGMKIPGPVVMMTPRNVGEEIGSMVKTKHPFLVKTISFPVDENRMDNIVTMPISQDIPITEKKTEFVIAPQEILLLEPGEYYVSFSITEIEDEIMARWADAGQNILPSLSQEQLQTPWPGQTARGLGCKHRSVREGNRKIMLHLYCS